MRRRLTLGLLTPGAMGGFSPLSLSPFAWYDPSDLSTLFQNSNGTGAVTANNDPVGYMADKSGNGRHVIQATAGSRPLYKTSGGVRWLEFDGSDDWMRATFTTNQPWTRVSGLRQLAWVNADRIYGPATSNAGFLFQVNAEPMIALYDGGIGGENTEATTGTDVVVTEVHNGASSKIAVDNAAYTTGDAGTNNNDGLTIAGDGDSPAAAAGFRFHGLVGLSGVAAGASIALLRTYLGAKQGRVL